MTWPPTPGTSPWPPQVFYIPTSLSDADCQVGRGELQGSCSAQSSAHVSVRLPVCSGVPWQLSAAQCCAPSLQPLHRLAHAALTQPGPPCPCCLAPCGCLVKCLPGSCAPRQAPRCHAACVVTLLHCCLTCPAVSRLVPPGPGRKAACWWNWARWRQPRGTTSLAPPCTAWTPPTRLQRMSR